MRHALIEWQHTGRGPATWATAAADRDSDGERDSADDVRRRTAAAPPRESDEALLHAREKICTGGRCSGRSSCNDGRRRRGGRGSGRRHFVALGNRRQGHCLEHGGCWQGHRSLGGGDSVSRRGLNGGQGAIELPWGGRLSSLRLLLRSCCRCHLRWQVCASRKPGGRFSRSSRGKLRLGGANGRRAATGGNAGGRRVAPPAGRHAPGEQRGQGILGAAVAGRYDSSGNPDALLHQGHEGVAPAAMAPGAANGAVGS